MTSGPGPGADSGRLKQGSLPTGKGARCCPARPPSHPSTPLLSAEHTHLHPCLSSGSTGGFRTDTEGHALGWRAPCTPQRTGCHAGLPPACLSQTLPEPASAHFGHTGAALPGGCSSRLSKIQCFAMERQEIWCHWNSVLRDRRACGLTEGRTPPQPGVGAWGGRARSSHHFSLNHLFQEALELFRGHSLE